MQIEAATVTIFAIIFVSTLVRTVFGFGHALIAMPLLALTSISMKTATPLIALIAVFLSLTIIIQDWRIIDLGSTWRLLVATVPGVPLGLLFLKDSYETTVKITLALIIIGFSLYSLLKPKFYLGNRSWSVYLFGFLAGILGGAYNTNSPPIVIYGTLHKWPAERFRATLQGYFFPAGVIVIAGHGLGGFWTPAVGRYFVFCLPALVMAIWLGNRLHRNIPQAHFDRSIHLLLILIGAALLLQTVLA
jgi:uncharacterized membrane protein YfcA